MWNVIVVDDSLSDLKLMAEILGTRGYAVRPMREGNAALAAALAEPPDLFMLDVRMPGIGGHELCRLLKAHPAVSAAPVIFISASDELQDIVEGFRSGGVDYVTKPFRSEEILARVETHLTLREMRRQLAKQNDALRQEVREREQIEAELMRMQGLLEERVKERTAELQASEERWRTIIETEPECVKVVDGNGRLLEMNAAGLSMLEAESFHEVQQQGLLDFILPEYQPGFLALHKSVMNGANGSLEFQITGLRGTRRWLETHAAPMRDATGCIVGLLGVTRDITSRKQAEEDRDRLFEMSLDMLVVAGFDGVFKQLNPACFRTLGWSAEELQGKPHIDFVHPDDVPATIAIDEKLRRGEEVRSFENRLRCKDGTYRWLSWNAFPLMEQRSIFSVCRDVTDAKRIGEALNESLVRFTSFAEATQYGFGMADLETGITYVNTALSRMLGETHPKDAIGRPFLEYYPPEAADKLRTEVLPILMDKGYWQGELELLTRDGRRIPVEENYFVINDAAGRPRCFGDILTDISERKRAEEALRESEERYRSLHEDNPSMYFTVAPGGTVLSVNRFGCEQLGYTAEELVGQSVLKVFHEEDKDAAARSIVSCIDNPGRVLHWELRKLRREGGVMWVKETGRALRGPDGRIVVFIVCEDITQGKLAEEEKEKLQAQLLQAMKMESVGRLAGGVAHDFNNMLMAILGHTELAMMRCPPSDRLHGNLEAIREAAQRSADLTRQLLAFARKQTVSPRVLDLNHTVESMLNMLQRLIGEDIDLVWKPGEPLWAVRIDPSQIDQLLANLCVNARDAITGVGKVTIETENVSFDEEYCALHKGFSCGDYVMLAVSDNGCGMGKEVLERLFEPFFTTKEVGKGTGLGLATVYGIVKQNDGFISVYSEPNQGTTFKIYLARSLGKPRRQRLKAVGKRPGDEERRCCWWKTKRRSLR